MKHWFIFFCVIISLYGCAGTQPVPANQTVYNVPSQTPKTFDLDITPTSDGDYLIDGKSLTLHKLYWKIRISAHSSKPITTALYHHNKQGTAMQYICYLMLAYKEKVASYYEKDGKITPVKMTSDNGASFNYFYHQCLDNVISQ